MIDRLYHHAGLSLIIAWMVLWPVSWFVAVPAWAVAPAIVAGLIIRETKFGNWVLSLVGHLSFALVMMTAAWLLARVGIDFPETQLWAKLAYLVASVVFYLSVFSVLRLDIYALFYRPWVRAAFATLLIAYCLLTGDVFVALSLLGSLALFQAKIGASNPIDHLHHFLVPIVVLVGLF